MASGAQAGDQPSHDGVLGRPGEVYENVAAEDDVEVVVDGVLRIHKVEALEADQPPQLRDDADLAATRVARGHEVTVAQRAWDGIDERAGIDRAAGLGDDAAADVGAEHGERPRAQAERLRRHHRNRIGLRAVRRRCAPELERVAAAPLLQRYRDRMLTQEGEMGRLAKEVGLVSRRAVDDVVELLLEPTVLEDRVSVFRQIGETERADTPAQAAFQHHAFVHRQLNAGMRLDESGERHEVLLAHAVVDVGAAQARFHATRTPLQERRFCAVTRRRGARRWWETRSPRSTDRGRARSRTRHFRGRRRRRIRRASASRSTAAARAPPPTDR